LDLAICLYRVGRDREAIEALEKGIALESELTWVNVLKAFVLERLGRAVEAQQAHEQALGDPSNPRAYLERGRIYEALGANDRAVQDLQKALELDPEFVDAYNSLAWHSVNYLNDNLEEATELAQKGSQLAKQQGDKTVEGNILDTLGWIYCKRDMIEKAFPLLEEARHLVPESLELEDHLAVCRLALGHATSLPSSQP
jgi:tetratricopeptide (TPR) repeat protein